MASRPGEGSACSRALSGLRTTCSATKANSGWKAALLVSTSPMNSCRVPAEGGADKGFRALPEGSSGPQGGLP
jgi:hypothetical protein